MYIILFIIALYYYILLNMMVNKDKLYPITNNYYEQLA